MAAPAAWAALATLVVAAGAAATAAPTAAGTAMTAAPVAAGAMAMVTAPTAACAAQWRQQGTSSGEGEQGAYTAMTAPAITFYFVLCCKFTFVSTFWLRCTNQAWPTLC